MEGVVQEAKGTLCTVSSLIKQRDMDTLACLAVLSFLPFHVVQGPAYGLLLPQSRHILHAQLNLQKYLYSHARHLISNQVKSTMQIKHDNYLKCESKPLC